MVSRGKNGGEREEWGLKVKLEVRGRNGPGVEKTEWGSDDRMGVR